MMPVLLLLLGFKVNTDAGISYGGDERPPPYVPSGASGVASISCRVCQGMINLEGKASHLVVKCNSCNEATVSTANRM